MRKVIALIMLISVFFISQGALASEEQPLDLSIKTLYSAPYEDSNVVYNIPVEVKLLDVSEDGNWYKVKIAYNVGPFGYTYVGWAPVPAAEILAEREAAEIAYLLDAAP